VDLNSAVVPTVEDGEGRIGLERATGGSGHDDLEGSPNPWTAAFGSAADGAALLPATIATISAPHEITIFEVPGHGNLPGLCGQRESK
jgi:hypothetical protein